MKSNKIYRSQIKFIVTKQNVLLPNKIYCDQILKLNKIHCKQVKF